MQKRYFLLTMLLFCFVSFFFLNGAKEVFHSEIAYEREMPYPTYNLPSFLDFAFDPVDLLSWSRFDIVAKYIYAYYREMQFETDWALRLYTDHLRIWGNFQEWDGSKDGLGDFLNQFHDILDSIKKNGFNPRISKIRIDDRKIPCEGSHRIGACLLYKKKITSYYNPNGIPPRSTMSSSTFFRNYTRYLSNGLPEKYLDDMAIYYAKLKKNTVILIVFPTAPGYHDELRKIIRLYGNIVYEKAVTFSERGQLNFIRELHNYSSWVGSSDDQFVGEQREIAQRFGNEKQQRGMRVWLVEFNAPEQKINCQQTIANLFQNEHGVYCSENHQETLRIARILFIANSIDFLNTTELKRNEYLERCLSAFKDMIKEHNIDKEFVCINEMPDQIGQDGFSFIASKYVNLPDKMPDFLKQKTIYTIPLDDIIFNPEHHFYYHNFKWAFVY